MNADHGDAVLAVVREATGLGEAVARATMGRVDRLGFEAELVLARSEGGGGGGAESSASGGGERLRARVAFPSPAEDRKALKDRLVEMTKAAAAKGAPKAEASG